MNEPTAIDALALSHVPRWVIVPRVKEQYVSDHTFRMMVIFFELVDRLKMGDPPMSVVRSLLYHDADESRTGDIPSTAKRDGRVTTNPAGKYHLVFGSEADEEWYNLYKLADLLEAATWIVMYGTGEHARKSAQGLGEAIDVACGGNTATAGAVAALFGEIVTDAGR